ncbi:apolipoprotein N-acyltransferase [Brevundimonas sp. 2R-24]|uniref:Apolipoprotein N-acyltransferase n=1 Tax=Peiella sedimenti TaxID=3061083 RepID=A0ABT8SLB4_9CAUL|nr:apolipoprotein N-acyltransferase [Caulobacteraceae bacterium XZ-24]
MTQDTDAGRLSEDQPPASHPGRGPFPLALAGALAAGAGAALAHPPFGFWIGLIGYPLLMLLSEGRRTRRGAFAVGWAAGFAYFLISCWWVAEAFLVNPDAHAWMAPFAATLLPMGLAIFWGLASLLYRWLKPQGVLRFFVFTALFCGLEWLRGHVLTGFPWNPAGASWEAGTPASQAAAVVGIYGLSFLTVAGLTAFAPLLTPGSRKRRVGAAVLGVVLLAALHIGGQARLLNAHVQTRDLSIRIVQADVPQEAKWSPERFRSIVLRYVNLSSRTGALTPDIIVWPEGALPAEANELLAAESWTAPAIGRALEPGQTLLFGGYRMGERPDVYFNSLIAARDDGSPLLEPVAVYDKHRLVPFGEYLPLAGLMTRTGLRSLVHMPSDFSAGPRPRPLDLGPELGQVQPLICYEGLYAGLPDGRAGRPQWIVNVSNDAWFGRTSGPLQHLNLAAYRAIEQGLPMVRATPTGSSAVIDPWGRIRDDQRLDPGESGVIDARLPEALASTPYSRFGDLMFLVLIVSGLTPLVLRRPRVEHGHMQPGPKGVGPVTEED